MIRNVLLGTLVLASIGLSAEKIDPWLKIELGKASQMQGSDSKSEVVYKQKVFIKLTSSDLNGRQIVEGYGGEFVSQVGDIVTANLDVKALPSLSKDSRVEYVEKPKKLRYSLDGAAVASGADKVRVGELSQYKGQGVIVGILDSGVDYTHPSISDRIIYIYDTTTGEVCDKAKITSLTCNQVDNVGHGTHVAGIAAGSGKRYDGTQSPFVGVAPAAEIIAVKVGNYDVSADGVIAGIEFVRNKAKEMGKPFVINLSLGSDLGPHDGSDLFSKALENYIKEGVIIVKAAGNSASDGIHVGGKLTTGAVASHSFVIGSEMSAIDIWYPGSDYFSVQISSPCGSTPFIPVSSTVTYQLGTCGTVNISSSDVNPLNGDKEIVIEIESAGVSSYIWTLTLSGDLVVDGSYHVWGAGLGFLDASQRYTLSSDSAVDGLIVVGSFTSKIIPSMNANSTLNDLSVFSGRGPTRGCSAGCPVLMKPDLTAPGEVLCSAYPPSLISGNSPCGETGYMALQGTSMAAPMVTGAIALMLSKNPKLNPASVKDILISTAYRDFLVQNAPNNDWGYGKLSVNGALAATPKPSSGGGCYVLPAGSKVLGDMLLVSLLLIGILLRGRLYR